MQICSELCKQSQHMQNYAKLACKMDENYYINMGNEFLNLLSKIIRSA